MVTTVEKDALLHFKHRHTFEITDFDQCDIVPLINWECKKSFAIRHNNLEAINDILLLHLHMRLLNNPVILGGK